MAFTARTRLVNPRLGTYFGIFTAAFAGLVLMALMLEQLGFSDTLVRLLMFAGPIALFAAIGIGANAREARDYFACGRRVPAFFNGLVLGVAALGGAGFLALTGSLFIIGFDAVCLAIGWYAGLVFMGVLFAPFVRKYGAYTLPTFLGRRFESRTVRIVAAATLSVPILLLLVAEARFAAYASAWLLGQSERLMVAVVMTCATAIVIAGGMRSLTWSSVAKAIAALLALAVPVSIVALMVSNLPLPQMTHGNVLRLLTRAEINQGVPIVLAPPLAFDLPREGVEQLVKRFIQSFGSIGSLSFFLMSFVAAAGIAASPSLLSRSGTTPGVYEARKSLGWAVLVTGIVLLTLPCRRRLSCARCCWIRSSAIPATAAQPGSSCCSRPALAHRVQDAGRALAGIGFERDAVAVCAAHCRRLFRRCGLSRPCRSAGRRVAALRVVRGNRPPPCGGGRHLRPAQREPLGRHPHEPSSLALLGAAPSSPSGSRCADGDPLQLFLWSLTFGARAPFRVLLLAIWGKRTNAWGALAAWSRVLSSPPS
jgi:cation/acetate symporter